MSSKEVAFSGLKISGDKVRNMAFEDSSYRNMASWTRVVLPMPAIKDVFRMQSDPIKNISRWIESNCTGMFFIGKFWIPGENYQQQYSLVFRFQNMQDAVLFKLQDLEEIIKSEE